MRYLALVLGACCLIEAMLLGGCTQAPGKTDPASPLQDARWWVGTTKALGSILRGPGWSSTGFLATARFGQTTTMLPSGKILLAGGRDDAGFLFSSEIFDPDSGAWSATGPLINARGYHAATLLPSGKVLVTGGFGGSADLSSAEIYDPALGTWSATGSLATRREYPTATLLASGKVLVAGGYNDTDYQLSSAELYDPDSGTWSATGSLSNGRFIHKASLLPSGKVLVSGGYGDSGFLSSSELYDPDAGAWSATGSLISARGNHNATLLPTGKVLAAGGNNNTDGPLSSSELYDPDSGSWSPTGSLAASRYHFTATLLPSGKVLLAGGLDAIAHLSSCELYDPDSGSWSAAGSLSTPRSYHAATLTPSGKVLVVGGYDINSVPLSSSELYDPAAGAWSATGSFSNERYLHTATPLPSGKILVAGGYNGESLPSSELYDPASGTWSATGSLLMGRVDHTATLLPSGMVLAAGGFGANFLASCELYDPGTGNWTAKGSLANERRLHTATLLSTGKVLVAGGSNDTGSLSSSELYDPASGDWSPTGTLVTGRADHSATLLPSGMVLVVGGYNAGSLSSSELYDPATGAWSTSGSLATGRYFHTATLLPSGKVLVTGGMDASALLSSELYDPASGVWSATGSLSEARESHTATLLASGTILVTGGTSGSTLSSSELYDPASGGWSAMGSLQEAREGHTATLLPSGKILVAGGENDVSYLSSSELYDDSGAQNAWRPVIANFPAGIEPGTSYTITGSNFRGVSEASSGGAASSATDFPLILLVRLASGNYGTMAESGRRYVLPSRDFSTTSATFTTPASSDLPGGHYLLLVMSNAIVSEAKVVLALAQIGTSCSSGVECISGFCTDGVCCNRTCDGPCDQACNLPGSTGSCVLLPEATPCDDLSFCNGVDTCDSIGVCIHTGDPCVGQPQCLQTCDEQNDRCRDPDGTLCDDGVACTADQCQSGICQSAPNDALCDDFIACSQDRCRSAYGCENLPQDSLCDDGIDCTLDICSLTLGCVRLPQDNQCPDDGAYCNGPEICLAAQGCIHGGDPCLALLLACDENTDTCQNCVLDNQCQDGIACTDDSCDTNSGNCRFTANNALCPDDGLFCDGNESCDPDRGCISSGDPCAMQSLVCDAASRSCNRCMQAQDCDDGIYCDGAERCGADGQCQAGPNPCEDNDQCTIDSCEETQKQCLHTADPDCAGAPKIDCNANLVATLGFGYFFDEDGRMEATGQRPLLWSKVSGPENLFIDAGTGLVQWVPQEAETESIEVLALNAKGEDRCAFDVTVAAETSGVPQTILALRPEEGMAPITVELDGSASIAPAGSQIISYRWDVGDGSSWGYGARLTHEYPLPGSYVVELLVTEAGGSTGRAQGVVRARNQAGQLPPIAQIQASATEGEGTLTVQLSCACEVGDAPIAGYAWDFADGSSSDLQAPEHLFGKGRYRIKLTVVDENGLTGTDWEEIVVTPAGSAKVPPLCQAGEAPTSGVLPLAVTYQGLYGDLDGQVVSFGWEFEDKTTSSQAIASKRYEEPGEYNATFRVEDNDSLTCQSSVEVVVSQTPGKTPPKILSFPAKTATCNQPYQYDQDSKPSARGDRPIYWKLGKEVGGQTLGKPQGLEINAQTGEIAWQPSDKQVGRNKVTLIVSNDQGADVQEFEIEVACTDTPAEGCGCGGPASPFGFWLCLLLAGFFFCHRLSWKMRS